MLTIRAMAEVGPWILDRIDVREGRVEQCEICSTKIKNVWVMVMQSEQREWRIGSCCGPKLEKLSQELWAEKTAPFHLSLRHLQTLERIVQWERECPGLAPRGYRLGWAAEQQLRLAQVLSAHERRVMGSHVSQALTRWQNSIDRYRRALQYPQAKLAVSLPTDAHH